MKPGTRESGRMVNKTLFAKRRKPGTAAATQNTVRTNTKGYDSGLACGNTEQSDKRKLHEGLGETRVIQLGNGKRRRNRS